MSCKTEITVLKCRISRYPTISTKNFVQLHKHTLACIAGEVLLAKKPNSRETSGKPRGGQKGHQGRRLVPYRLLAAIKNKKIPASTSH